MSTSRTPGSSSTSSPFKSDCLRGHVALITGGGSGIGLETAQQLGLHGARVAIMGRREGVLAEAVATLRGLGIEALSTTGDVRKKEDAAAAVQRVVGEWGQLDILVNGAAGNFLQPAESLSVNGFRTVLDIDAVGTFNMSLAARPYLARKEAPGRGAADGGGLIVNISATLQYSAAWYQVHLTAAKAAVDATTRTLALEWGTDYGIRCNTVSPGPVESTPGMAKLAPAELGLDPETQVPLGRMAKCWDVAMAILFLGTDAGKYLNGANIIVDGGAWLFHPRIVDRDVIKSLSKKVEKWSREKDFVKTERSRL